MCPVRPLLTLSDVSTLLRIPRETIKKMVADRRLASVKIGRHRLVRPEDLEAFVAARVTDCLPDPPAIRAKKARATAEIHTPTVAQNRQQRTA